MEIQSFQFRALRHFYSQPVTASYANQSLRFPDGNDTR